jgi:hypothetical protein
MRGYLGTWVKLLSGRLTVCISSHRYRYEAPGSFGADSSLSGSGHKRTLAGYSHTPRGDHPGARAASLSDARHRLCRDLGKRFGDEACATDELVAEIGAAFLCTELALPKSPTARIVW